MYYTAAGLVCFVLYYVIAVATLRRFQFENQAAFIMPLIIPLHTLFIIVITMLDGPSPIPRLLVHMRRFYRLVYFWHIGDV